MNPYLYPIVTAGMAIAPIQQPPVPQTVYVANLSATDGRDAGAYYQVTPMPQPYPVTPYVVAPVPMQMMELEGE